MRVINRTAVTVVGAEPYLEWTRQKQADFNQGALTVVRAKTYGSAFLLPEFELEEDVQEWVEENAGWLFEFQLAAWNSNRDRKSTRLNSSHITISYAVFCLKKKKKKQTTILKRQRSICYLRPSAPLSS